MKRTRKIPTAVAAIAAFGMLVAGCGGGDSGSSDGPVELTLSTWGQFGYEDLITQYEQENPGVTVKQSKASDASAARDAMLTGLAANSGLADVVAVENGWVGQMMEFPDKWVAVPDDLKSRWLEWKSASVTDDDGTLRMYGVDAAPAGICYDKDLLAAAGLPTDRNEVAQLLQGDWSHFVDVGRNFVQTTGTPWIASVGEVSQSQIFQQEYSFEDEDNEIIAATNPDVKAAYDSAVSALDVSAKMPMFTDDWNKGLGRQAFATQICPSWMLGIIKSNAPDSTSWDIANVFPDGGMNWGGSYLAVPTQSKHQEEAAKLAAWLTAPEQQIAAFEAVGAFPSQEEALTSDTLLTATDTYMNTAPIGEIFAARAQDAPSRTYSGPHASELLTYFNEAVTRVETGAESAEESWSTFESDIASIQ